MDLCAVFKNVQNVRDLIYALLMFVKCSKMSEKCSECLRKDLHALAVRERIQNVCENVQNFREKIYVLF